MKLSTLLKRSVAVLGGGCLLLVGWAGLELVRPLPDDHLDPATYQRTATGTRAVVVPLTIRVAPVTSLALQNSDLEATLERDERGNIHIVFAVTDTSGRRIEGAFHENSPLPSLPTQLLAPVGASARTPVMFPHFVLHDFDFVRLGGRMEVTVDGHPLQLGGIPVPLVAQGQPRSFVKFVPETDILEVFPADVTELRHAMTDADRDTVTEGEVTHLFAGDALERIRVRTTEVVFDPPLDLRARGEGDWSIRTEGHGGGVQGRYVVSDADAQARLQLRITRAVLPHQRDVLYRLFVNEKSFFGTWPLAYCYDGTFDLDAGTVSARWFNDAPLG
ncbi:hypothetical protein J4N02_11310 [Propioniciclava sp. MC1595]|uniref:hypothetical protein n=1 Tax=Propioniciclava sp. MC1595 TaxID=2760308 RepID=UPI0016624A46|nr:hypothetical protein [Propioniciclava sp. MC1595]MBB1494140.1 hypothetical protein [Propioniciclava sp. MC1595]QTE25125.1 hypothetical protein J4N02_11310 [Propioniciclava sp. MC1595]